MVAFGAHNGRFADNSAYLFLHMVNDPDGPRCVWVTTSDRTFTTLSAQGLPVVKRWTLAGIRVALRASCFVFTHQRFDVNVWLSDGAVAINLWHGVGLKRGQRDRADGPGARLYAAPERSLTARVFFDDRNPVDYVVATSDMMAQKFSDMFATPKQNCVRLGYPRNDHLVTGEPPPEILRDGALRDALTARRPVVGYFPTWRPTRSDLPMPQDVLEHVASIVAQQGGTTVFKAHEVGLVQVDARDDLIVLPSDADLNAYLGLCDVLITDYSSVAWDFILMDRPIVIYLADIEEFTGDRGFFLDPLEYTPGVFCHGSEELYRVLGDLKALRPTSNYAALRNQFMVDCTTPGAPQRVAEFVAQVARGTWQPLPAETTS